MEINRNLKNPLYLQVKQIILEKIKKQEWKTGDFIPTESELCKEMVVSRFPIRQAMDELVKEGYLQRTRGKGTLVKNMDIATGQIKHKILGLIMTSLTVGINGQILTGFEREARRSGYLTLACSSEDSIEIENSIIEQVVEQDVAGIIIFSCKNTEVISKWEHINASGIYFSLIDRNPGIHEVDYVGSDNMGGAYSAVHHLGLQGFQNTMFISDATEISSVNERLAGYQRAVEDFDMTSIACMIADKYVYQKPLDEKEILLNMVEEELVKYKRDEPLGIFCINDYVAMRCIELCEKLGFEIGKDVAIIGFDNIPESSCFKIPLTTVEQNSFLVGQKAAELAISKIEGKTKQIFCNKVPTQLVVRESCGEYLKKVLPIL